MNYDDYDDSFFFGPFIAGMPVTHRLQIQRGQGVVVGYTQAGIRGQQVIIVEWQDGSCSYEHVDDLEILSDGI